MTEVTAGDITFVCKKCNFRYVEVSNGHPPPSCPKCNGAGVKLHGFKKSDRDNKQYVLDLHYTFGEWYRITETSPAEDRRGLDCRWERLNETAKVETVQYKTEHYLRSLERVFIETWSNYEAQIRGWAYTCESALLVIYSPELGRAWIAWMKDVKAERPTWEAYYDKRESLNEDERTGGTYLSKGVSVPISDFEKVCILCGVPVEKAPPGWKLGDKCHDSG